MCGIFGYIGPKDASEVCLKGIELLEYRGYDSTGIAGLYKGALLAYKKAGKLKLFKENFDLPSLDLAIAHTRWATHGKVSDENAHPHFDGTKSLALIHNGILENYTELKEKLLKEGAQFSSETDTEVIAELLQRRYQGDLVEAFSSLLPELKGSFAIVCIHKDHPDEIVAIAKNCPLSIAYDDAKTESLLSSDPNAFIGSFLNILFLQNGEIARVKKGEVMIYGKKLRPIARKAERLQENLQPPSKQGYSHYMLKEIFEQSASIQRGFLGRCNLSSLLAELKMEAKEIASLQNSWVLGCGTSYHAGQIGTYFFETLAKLPSCCDIASEARYRPPLFSKNTLAVAISQSGETADTLAALRVAEEYGCKLLSLCNVKNSTIVRESDSALFLHAGPEISVCSTKAFTSQLTLLFLLSLLLAKERKTLSPAKEELFLSALKSVPKKVEIVLDKQKEMESLAKKYAHFENFFFMGRRYMLPTAFEAALKLKEISYTNANAYPAGELKHGAIALLDEKFPVIAFLADQKTEEKMMSSLMEVKARGAPLLVLAPETVKGVENIADDVFWLPPLLDELSPFPTIVGAQLFAYYIALERGCEIDQPRNLAKSVTVE